MKIIYEKDAIDALKEYFEHNENRIESMFTSDVYWHDDTVLDVIRSVPSVQPEVVRCENCKHFNHYFVECDSNFGLQYVNVDDFCSRAERRTDE